MYTVHIDADACPVTAHICRICASRNVPVVAYCDLNHQLALSHGRLHQVGQGRDAVDLAIINACRKNDVVITQDYGLASLVLAKKAHALHPSGLRYTEDNIMPMLHQRHTAAKMRRAGGRHVGKNTPKRTAADDAHFTHTFEALLDQLNTSVDIKKTE